MTNQSKLYAIYKMNGRYEVRNFMRSNLRPDVMSRFLGHTKSEIIPNREKRKDIGVAVSAFLKDKTMGNFQVAISVLNNFRHLMPKIPDTEKFKVFREYDKQHKKIESGEWVGLPPKIEKVLQSDPLNDVRIPHMSVDFPGLIAYNQSVEKIERDIQTTCRIGRYLSKFYPQLTDEDVRELVHDFEAAQVNYELEFIPNTDPHAWVEAYRDEVRASDSNYTSCMIKNDSVGVYAYPDNDLTLIVLRNRDNRVIARTIGNTKLKGYIRAYTNREFISSNTFISLLDKAGWSQNDRTLNDQKIHLKYNGDAIVCPYIDGKHNHVSVCGDHLLIGDVGIDACNSDGLFQDLIECDNCGDDVDENNIIYIDDSDERVCSSCVEHYYVNVHTRRVNTVLRRDDDYDIIRCSSDDEYYFEGDMEYFNIEICSETDDYYFINDMVFTAEGEWVWQHYYKLVRLDEESLEHESRYCLSGNSVTLPDGRTVYEDDEGHWLAEIAAEKAEAEKSEAEKSEAEIVQTAQVVTI